MNKRKSGLRKLHKRRFIICNLDKILPLGCSNYAGDDELVQQFRRKSWRDLCRDRGSFSIFRCILKLLRGCVQGSAPCGAFLNNGQLGDSQLLRKDCYIVTKFRPFMQLQWPAVAVITVPNTFRLAVVKWIRLKMEYKSAAQVTLRAHSAVSRGIDLGQGFSLHRNNPALKCIANQSCVFCYVHVTRGCVELRVLLPPYGCVHHNSDFVT